MVSIAGIAFAATSRSGLTDVLEIDGTECGPTETIKESSKFTPFEARRSYPAVQPSLTDNETTIPVEAVLSVVIGSDVVRPVTIPMPEV